jgi:hypothetical protein
VPLMTLNSFTCEKFRRLIIRKRPAWDRFADPAGTVFQEDIKDL